MKKNLLSILILALLIVNIVLSAIMMFSVTSASKKTTELVTDIASVLKLELGSVGSVEEIPMSKTDVYNIETPLQITLREGEDKTPHWCIVSVALSMNIKDKGYKKYGDAESMQSKEPLIASVVIDVIGSYTIEELRNSDTQEAAKKEILGHIQSMYDSQFIYKVSFSDIKFQ